MSHSVTKWYSATATPVLTLVPGEGLEPPRLAAADFKSAASAIPPPRRPAHSRRLVAASRRTLRGTVTRPLHLTFRSPHRTATSGGWAGREDLRCERFHWPAPAACAVLRPPSEAGGFSDQRGRAAGLSLRADTRYQRFAPKEVVAPAVQTAQAAQRTLVERASLPGHRRRGPAGEALVLRRRGRCQRQRHRPGGRGAHWRQRQSRPGSRTPRSHEPRPRRTERSQLTRGRAAEDATAPGRRAARRRHCGAAIGAQRHLVRRECEDHARQRRVGTRRAAGEERCGCAGQFRATLETARCASRGLRRKPRSTRSLQASPPPAV